MGGSTFLLLKSPGLWYLVPGALGNPYTPLVHTCSSNHPSQPQPRGKRQDAEAMLPANLDSSIFPEPISISPFEGREMHVHISAAPTFSHGRQTGRVVFVISLRPPSFEASPLDCCFLNFTQFYPRDIGGGCVCVCITMYALYYHLPNYSSYQVSTS